MEQEAAIAIAERSASQVEYEPTKTCSQCGETMKTGDESCGTCKYSAGENYHIEDVTDDFEDMSYLEDSGASLSANSLEKLEAKKILAYGYASS